MRKAIPVLAYLYLVLIIAASLGRFMLGVFPKGIKNSDKYGHAFAYMVFVVIWGLYFLYKNQEPVVQKRFFSSGLKALIFAVLFGIIMEVAQWGLTSYRQFDVLDMLANTFGALIGMLIFNILPKYSGFIKKSEL